MAKKSESKPDKGNWYKVLVPSFINERFFSDDDIADPKRRYVQYDGIAGSNLEAVNESEVREAGIDIQEPEENELDNREAELNQREKALVKREQDIVRREKELDDLTEAANKRAKELDEREINVTTAKVPLDSIVETNVQTGTDLKLKK
jgi:hypothetical protein